MRETPAVPFLFSSLGLIVSALAALLVGLAGLGVFGVFQSGSILGGMIGGYYAQMRSPCIGQDITNSYSPWGLLTLGNLTWLWVPAVIMSVAIGALGVVMMNSSRMKKTKIAGVLLLIAAALAFPTAFGFLAGSILLALAGVLSHTQMQANKSS